MKRKKKRSMPCFVFTPETIQVTQEALNIFEQSLQREDRQRPKVAFAEETMNQVKDKLEEMSTSVGLMCLTTFDYNEKIVLVAAIQLYIFDLNFLSSTPQSVKKLQQCRKIVTYFSSSMHKTAGTRQAGGGLYNERKRVEE